MFMLLFEIAMLVLGSIGLTTGKLTFTRNFMVEGTKARITGLILAIPAPLGFLAGTLIRMWLGRDTPPNTVLVVAGYAEIGLVILCLAGSLVYAYASRRSSQPAAPAQTLP